MATALASPETLLDELDGLDLFEIGAKELGTKIVEVERMRARLDAAENRLIDRFDAALMAPVSGYRNTRSFLTHRAQMTGSNAGRRVKVARALRRLPLVAAEFDEGRFSFDQAAAFAYAVNPRTEEAMATDEAALVELAAGLTVDDLTKELTHWKEGVDVDGTEPDPGHGSRSFNMAQGFGGNWLGNLELGSADGAFVKGCLDQIVAELHEQEARDVQLDISLARTPGQRRADALVEIFRRALATDITRATPPRAAVSLLVTLEDLEADRSGHTDGGDRVKTSGLDRLSCDCSVSPIGWSVDGVPLSHGRTRRLPTPAQRRAAIAQYGGCIFPSCDAPPGWADIHHFQHWKRDVGPTDQANLGPACPFHHPLFHEGGWNVHVGSDGELVFTMPGGIVFDPHPGWGRESA